MKRLTVVFLFFVTFTVFFGCSKNNPIAPEQNQRDLATASLAKKVVIPFYGEEKFVATLDPGTWTPLPNGLSLAKGGMFEYYDEASDPRVTGKLIFTINGVFDNTFSGKFKGTGELTTKIGGSWDMKIVGERIATKGSFAKVVGHGKGVLEGLIAHWKYTRLEPEKDDFTFEGFIVER